MTNWYAVVRAGQQKYCFTKFHESFEDAKYEAERLAELENDKFYILKMVGFAQKKPMPIEYVDLEEVK